MVNKQMGARAKMGRPSAFDEIEANLPKGKTLKEFLVDELNAHPTIKETASALHMSRTTLMTRMGELGLSKRSAKYRAD